MSTAENKLMRRRIASAYLSSVFSISLVLLLVGIASLLMVNASNVQNYFKEHMKVSVIFSQKASDKETLRYYKALEARDFVKEVEYISREQGVKEMEDLLGADFLTVFDTAPIPVSLDVTLRAEYVTPAQVDSLIGVISDSPIVDDVVWQKSLIEKLNANLRSISLVLAVFIGLMLFISYVLIGNTIRLNLFSKRFSIHTMKLVGATKAFIRKPFLIRALMQGVIAALLAIIIMLAALLVLKTEFEQLFTIFQLQQLLTVMAIMLVSGMVICLLSTFVVVGRMVNLQKEDLYM